jgi:hypothetical protein
LVFCNVNRSNLYLWQREILWQGWQIRKKVCNRFVRHITPLIQKNRSTMTTYDKPELRKVKHEAKEEPTGVEANHQPVYWFFALVKGVLHGSLQRLSFFILNCQSWCDEARAVY